MLTKYYTAKSAIHLAYIAMAAYFASINETKVQFYLKQSELQLHTLCEFINESSEINGIVLALKNDPTCIIIGFTGTHLDSFETIYDDLDEKLVPFPWIGGNVSRGFLTAANSIVNMTRACVPQNPKQIWLVGHSLGGAIATLISAHFVKWYPRAEIITYTFASPRVGDQKFASRYDNKTGIYSNRLQNYWDVIPRLPTFDYQGYRHVQILDLLTRNKTTNDTTCVAHAEAPGNTLYNIYEWRYQHQLATYISLLQTCAAQK